MIYTIIYISDINEERNIVSVETFGSREVDGITNFLLGKDLSKFAVFKNQKHIQLPERPLSTTILKEILLSA